ncbi:MAG: phage tail tube protein [Cyanobacteria bacterium J06638_20]
MGRTLTNNTGLAVAKEASLGVLPGSPDWKQLEPNDITNFGAEITTVARDPISADRQRRKGTVTDLDSAPEYEADLTMDIVDDFIAGFCFVVATNENLRFNGASATGTGYTVPALDAAQGAVLQSGSLVFAQGYSTTANNGLKPLTADAASTDTELTVAGLSAETASESAILEYAGIRAATGDLTLTVSGTTAVLSTTLLDFTTLGLTVGQFIHIGGLTTSEQFDTGAGYARITSIAATEIGLDKLAAALATDDGVGDTVDLLFGQFIRNVATTDPAFIEQSFQFEAQFPNLGPAGETGFEYATGNFCNQLEFTFPLTDKATVTASFVGLDTETPVFVAKTGSDTPRQSLKTTALNTSSDFGRLRIQNTDETGLTTDFKEITLTLNNNASPEKVLGCLGARFINTGNFEVDLETQVLFTSEEVIEAIKENRTVTFDLLVNNDNGSMAIDIPSLTLGAGDKELPVNESILINLTGQAFRDPTLGTSLSVSLFPAAPDVTEKVVN